VNGRGFATKYWNSGVVETAAGGESKFTLVLEHPGALRQMLLLPSQLHIAEGYVYGDFDIEGDLGSASLVASVVRERISAPGALIQLVRLLLPLPGSHRRRVDAKRTLGAVHSAPLHTEERDAAAVRAHYDVGNDFYSLFLDQRMVYSCAYYETGAETLEEAQVAKFEHICRKLRLQPGERLLDIGCGWGGLIQYAVSHYGVLATGITVSQAQAELAIARIAAAGLADRCHVELRDYRAITDLPPFDKVASVGMAEHVGESQLSAYFEQAWRLLRPGGLLLNHCITKDRPDPRSVASLLTWREGDFTRKYVFPDGELVPLDALIRAGLGTGFEVRDVESLREHYARTLREWVRRLEGAQADVIALVGPQLYRIWRLHMAGGATSFEHGRLTIHQVLYARPDAAGAVPALPLSRADLYRPIARRQT
jgi:cyclopropane-fatty-acyl-phospholipid synthase